MNHLLRVKLRAYGTPICDFLKLAPLSLSQFMLAASISVASVVWYEIVKLVKFIRKKNRMYNNDINGLNQ